MHKYLRSIGFSEYKTEQAVRSLLDSFEERYFDFARRYVDPSTGEMWLEIRAQIAATMGVCIMGVLDSEGRFHRTAYYPYIWSDDVSSSAQVMVTRKLDGSSLSVSCDDTRVGVTLIFQLDNPFDFLQKSGSFEPMSVRAIKLAGFSTNGKILLGNSLAEKKNPKNTSVQDPASAQGDFNLFEAAKKGQTEAIEQLAFEEMSNIAALGKRLENEDIYSIISSVFMPQGVECDLYSVVGDIVDMAHTTNLLTGEGIYDLTLNVNDMIIHIATHEADLEGEPAIGRRFKGQIWLMGRVEI